MAALRAALCEADESACRWGVFNSPVISRDGLQLENRFMSFARYLAEKSRRLPICRRKKQCGLPHTDGAVADIQAFAAVFEEQLARWATCLHYIVQSAQR